MELNRLDKVGIQPLKNCYEYIFILTLSKTKF